jgi:hypothetical protein
MPPAVYFYPWPSTIPEHTMKVPNDEGSLVTCTCGWDEAMSPQHYVSGSSQANSDALVHLRHVIYECGVQYAHGWRPDTEPIEIGSITTDTGLVLNTAGNPIYENVTIPAPASQNNLFDDVKSYPWAKKTTIQLTSTNPNPEIVKALTGYDADSYPEYEKIEVTEDEELDGDDFYLDEANQQFWHGVTPTVEYPDDVWDTTPSTSFVSPKVYDEIVKKLAAPAKPNDGLLGLAKKVEQKKQTDKIKAAAKKFLDKHYPTAAPEQGFDVPAFVISKAPVPPSHPVVGDIWIDDMTGNGYTWAGETGWFSFVAPDEFPENHT